MKKAALTAIVTACILVSGTFCMARAAEEQPDQKMQMKPGQGMMGQGMMGKGMMGRHPMGKGMMCGMPMCGGMMGKSMVPTGDGGVVIMIGNKLYKYDKELKFKKEAEIPIDYQNIKDMMMKMREMGMGTYGEPPEQGESSVSPGEEGKKTKE